MTCRGYTIPAPQGAQVGMGKLPKPAIVAIRRNSNDGLPNSTIQTPFFRSLLEDVPTTRTTFAPHVCSFLHYANMANFSRSRHVKLRQRDSKMQGFQIKMNCTGQVRPEPRGLDSESLLP